MPRANAAASAEVATNLETLSEASSFPCAAASAVPGRLCEYAREVCEKESAELVARKTQSAASNVLGLVIVVFSVPVLDFYSTGLVGSLGGR